MVWLFVTSPFFRDEWTTVNPFHGLSPPRVGGGGGKGGTLTIKTKQKIASSS